MIDCRSRGDIDNQLGYLHTHLRGYKWPDVDRLKRLRGFTMEPLENYPYVFKIENVLDDELARKVRAFVNEIPFDDNLEVINNTDNPPKNNVVAHTVFDQEINDPTQWMWEKYHWDFYRAVPLSFNSFAGSPLIELMDVLRTRWQYARLGTNINQCHIATWVLQWVPKGHGIDYHKDDGYGRKVAFVYYLTEDWDENDGGELVLYDQNKEVKRYLPLFNTMIAWDMSLQPSLLHCVQTVKSDKKRIAFVGFYGQ